MADKEESEKTIAEDLVVTKYKMAGDIVNRKYSIKNIFIIIRNMFICTLLSPSEYHEHSPYGNPLPGLSR